MNDTIQIGPPWDKKDYDPKTVTIEDIIKLKREKLAIKEAIKFINEQINNLQDSANQKMEYYDQINTKLKECFYNWSNREDAN